MLLSRSVRSVLFICFFASVLPAQQDRITAAIDARRSVVVSGSVSPKAKPQYDRGAVEPDFRLGNITLMLRPSADQQAALEQLLAEQQDPASPNYHNWLTPEAYAERFGATSADFDKITAWLRSQGFAVQYTARGRDFISFSGTAAQVRAALHTDIHRYQVGTETHFANSGDLSLPAAVAPMVAGVLGLHDFRLKAPRKQFVPNFTDTDGSHYLVPDDLAVIYNLAPLYDYGYTGAGQSIVIVGQSSIDDPDIDMFRTNSGIPAANLQLIPVGSFPGDVPDDEIEAQLDLEWAGAIARSATLIYVYSDDVMYSAYYAIDNNLAPVISESYGLCEYQVGINRMGLYYFQAEAQKANAQGITWVASSGDSGAAGCDYDATVATQGLGVSLPASVPEITAVGGTEFNEGSGNYWSSINGLYRGSALSYIPETAWNDTVASGGLAASGGGLSAVYKKPAWQTGPGVPNDGARDVPDVSLDAANAHDPYLIISEESEIAVGGTSAAAPSFAGMIAVLNQFLVQNGVQAKPGLGNINPKLYSMAASGKSGVFHDITTGNNIVPCAANSLDCVGVQSGNTGSSGSTGINIAPCQTPTCGGGSFGYSAGVGYDLVTGLGSVDAYNLVTVWGGIPVAPTTTALAANPATILSSGSTVLTATVKVPSGGRTPAGPVSFTLGTHMLGTATLTGSGGTASASFMVPGGQLLAGSNAVQASYAGNPTSGPSSGSATVTVGAPTPAPTTTAKIALSVTPNPVYQQAPDANGATFSFTVQLNETAGVATSITGFIFDGVSFASSIGQFFGSTTLPAHGALSATLKAGNIPAPTTVMMVFTGIDSTGAAWTQRITVPFLPQQTGIGD
jgi:subtilase family serine protease